MKPALISAEIRGAQRCQRRVLQRVTRLAREDRDGDRVGAERDGLGERNRQRIDAERSGARDGVEHEHLLAEMQKDSTMPAWRTSDRARVCLSSAMSQRTQGPSRGPGARSASTSTRWSNGHDGDGERREPAGGVKPEHGDHLRKR